MQRGTMRSEGIRGRRTRRSPQKETNRTRGRRGGGAAQSLRRRRGAGRSLWLTRGRRAHPGPRGQPEVRGVDDPDAPGQAVGHFP